MHTRRSRQVAPLWLIGTSTCSAILPCISDLPMTIQGLPKSSSHRTRCFRNTSGRASDGAAADSDAFPCLHCRAVHK
ncbi:hypothetical protein BD309DRAFT_965803 [Dichomitus squalens]|nr:hypothetical protein BD309DRAFT_965803 [Dichomitus squalens]